MPCTAALLKALNAKPSPLVELSRAGGARRFCLRLEECCIGSNPGANLIGLHATSDVNNLDVINSFFHGSHQFAGIVISGGMQVNIQGNVIEGLGGPAIVVNDVTALTIQARQAIGPTRCDSPAAVRATSNGLAVCCAPTPLRPTTSRVTTRTPGPGPPPPARSVEY